MTYDGEYKVEDVPMPLVKNSATEEAPPKWDGRGSSTRGTEVIDEEIGSADNAGHDQSAEGTAPIPIPDTHIQIRESPPEDESVKGADEEAASDQNHDGTEFSGSEWYDDDYYGENDRNDDYCGVKYNVDDDDDEHQSIETHNWKVHLPENDCDTDASSNFGDLAVMSTMSQPDRWRLSVSPGPVWQTTSSGFQVSIRSNGYGPGPPRPSYFNIDISEAPSSVCNGALLPDAENAKFVGQKDRKAMKRRKQCVGCVVFLCVALGIVIVFVCQWYPARTFAEVDSNGQNNDHQQREDIPSTPRLPTNRHRWELAKKNIERNRIESNDVLSITSNWSTSY